MTKTITVLVPVFNETASLPKLFKRLVKVSNTLKSFSFHFLFVDDGSQDNSLAVIKGFAKTDKRVGYISLSRNFGKEVAMLAGIDHVESDALVIIDADLQDPPELIPKMVKLWQKGHDEVYARRSERRGETWLKQATSWIFYRILQRSTKITIQKDTGDFRLLDKRCVMALRQLREKERFTKGLYSWVGYNKCEITYVREARAGGKTKWNYFQLFNHAVDGIVSFTTAPLRFASILGLVISLFAFLYIVYLVTRTFLYGSDVDGYPSIMATVLFLGGVQLLALGIIGEYVGRVFNETKARPLYLVDEYHKPKRKK